MPRDERPNVEALVCPWCTNDDPRLITPLLKPAINGSGKAIFWCQVCSREFDA